MVRETAAGGVPVGTVCWVLGISTSGYYEWDNTPASERAWEQAHQIQSIREAPAAFHGNYGHRRVNAELVLGQLLKVRHGRVECLLRSTRPQGVHRRRLRGCARRDQTAIP